MTVSARMQRKGHLCTPLVGSKIGAATMENSVEVPQKIKRELLYDPEIPHLGSYPKEVKSLSWKDTCTPTLTAASFAASKTGKRPKCPPVSLMAEWVEKVWYAIQPALEHVHTLRKFPRALCTLCPRSPQPLLASFCLSQYICPFWTLLLKVFIYLFLERGERREKERERNTDVREKHQSVASCTCHDQIKPPAQACALTGNQTNNLSLCGKTRNQLSHTGGTFLKNGIVYYVVFWYYLC